MLYIENKWHNQKLQMVLPSLGVNNIINIMWLNWWHPGSYPYVFDCVLDKHLDMRRANIADKLKYIRNPLDNILKSE